MSALPPTRNAYRLLDAIERKLDIIVQRMAVLLAISDAKQKLASANAKKRRAKR